MQTAGKTQRMVLLGLFAAIVLVMAFTPLGYIQLPFIKATALHVPVIIGSILLGPGSGAVLGTLFGLTSLINNTMTPAVLSFAFSPAVPVPGTGQGSPFALLVCFVPRILVGILPYYVYRLANKWLKRDHSFIGLTVAGASGALINTLLVMPLIFLLFKDAYALVRDIPVEAVAGAVMAVIFANGIPEAIVATFITPVVCKAVLSLPGRQRTAQP